MNNNSHSSVGRRAMALVTLLLCLGFFTLYHNRTKQFEDAEAGYKNKSVLYLNKDMDTKELSDLLLTGNYISDEQDKDARFIAGHIQTKLCNGAELPNLGELNKRTFRIPAALADSSGGDGLKLRVEESFSTLGITDTVIALYTQPPGNSLDLHSGDYSIQVTVQKTDTALHGMKKQLFGLFDKDKKPAAGVLVRLKEHYYLTDTVGTKSKLQYEAQEDTLGYAFTNEKGIATFTGLKKDGYYSVLPVKKGFEYGASKGTAKGALGRLKARDRKFTFLQREHQITPFDILTYQRLKDDNVLTVRTPSQFKSNMIVALIFFFIAWWSVSFFLRDRSLLLPVLMFLSGTGLLMMYAITNPLTDKLLGYDMAIGAIAGVILLGIISKINILKFFNSQHQWFGVQGIGYLILALVLLGLLFVFGSGPEGSGVKVNLFFFQPSEITKYLIVLFLAIFFKNNAEKIQKFSEEFDWKHIKAQTKTVAVAMLGLLILIGCYLVLGDMGPALVLAVTFVIIYSVVRRDFWQLLAGILSFVALLFLGYQFDRSPLTMAGFATLWLFLWLGYGLGKPRKQLYESAIFMNLLISVFLFGAPVMNIAGLSHQAQRLEDRSDICLSGVWDNEVRGGDQVAQGLWSASTGGLTGQGLGAGNPNLTPAFHTDMIFTSIGEELGWTGLLLVVLCMMVLIHRSLHIGYKSGNPFLFFLAAGIAVVTGVQFLVITLGSTGLIPLTGVAVPFLSFGKTSLIINLAAFGMLFFISKKQATELQAEDFEEKQYHRMVGVSSFAYCSISVVLLGFLLWTQCLDRDSYLVRPAFVTNQQGERVVEYNPRIQLLVKNLDAGNIYDRNGVVLATNDKDLIQKQIDAGKFAGVDKAIYTKELKQRKQRYYPFGKNLFFMVGDYNTKVLWSFRENNPVGYLAEIQHLAALRGFNNLRYDENGNIKKGTLTAKKYKGSSFLNPVKKDYEYTEYDYSAILSMLKDGINGDSVKAWNKEREGRDISLTVDAALQTKMQNEIISYLENAKQYGINENFKDKKWNKLRISVVVLNAENGDLLCSANYPLPDQDLLRNSTEKYYNDTKDKNFKAYTDRDLGLTYQTAPGSTAKVMSALAGLQKDEALAEKRYFIHYNEIIERKANGSATDEPNNYRVSMEDAIVKSSNCYFINLVNDNDLYTQLDSVYEAVGIRIENTIPYFLNYNREQSEKFKTGIYSNQRIALSLYRNYIDKRDAGKMKPSIMSKGEWQWAWGQGTLDASPLNMARIVSIVANGGNFAPTQFILTGNENLKKPEYKPVPIVSSSAAGVLKGYMQQESAKHRKNGHSNFSAGMGGKTGTPERVMKYFDNDIERIVYTDIDRKQNGKMNDGWYIFFINSPKENAPLAAAVRMERLGAGISGNAVRLTDKVVLKTLTDLGYITK